MDRTRGIEIARLDEKEGEEADEAPATPFEKKQEREWDEIRAELSDENEIGLIIRVYRIRTGPDGTAIKGAKEVFLFDVVPSEMPVLTRLRDQYGSGLYRTRVYRQGRVYAQWDHWVEAPAKVAGTSEPPKPELSSLASALSQMQQQQMEFMERVMARFGNPSQQTLGQPIDPIAMLDRAISLVKGLIPPPAQGGTMDQSVTMLLKGIELAQQVSKGDGETNLYDLIKVGIENIGGFGEALKAMQTTSLPAAPARPAIPAKTPPSRPQSPTAQPATTQANGQEQPQVSNMMDQAKQLVSFLLPKAIANKPPEIYADYLLEELPDGAIVALGNTPNLLDQMCFAFPDIAPYRDWFAQLLDALLIAVDDPADDLRDPPNAANGAAPASSPVDTGGGSGGSSDLAVNGPTSKTW